MATSRPRRRTLRQRVEKRANYRCEYCHAPQAACGYLFHSDHIDPKSQGGPDDFHNRALACCSCNGSKHDFINGIDPGTGTAQPLFHPRTDRWEDHFRWSADMLVLEGITAKGRATVARLKMNDPIRLTARAVWVRTGYLP